MKRLLMGGLSAAMLLGGLALTGGAASAVVDEQPEQPPCYEQVTEYRYERSVPTTEYRYEREVEKPTYGDVIEKEVRGVIQTKAVKNWYDTGTFDWIDYPNAGPVNDDGRSRSGPHNSTFNQTGNSFGDTRYKSTEYRYVVVGQFQNGTTTETEDSGWVSNPPAGDGWVEVESRPGTPIQEGPTDWLTEPPAGEGWTQYGESRTVNGKRIPCPVEKLRLTFLQPCEPAQGTPEFAEWRIRNTNDFDVEYKIALGGTGASIPLVGTVPPGDTIFTTPWGARTVKIETFNDLGGVAGQDTKAGGDSFNGQDCPIPPPPPCGTPGGPPCPTIPPPPVTTTPPPVTTVPDTTVPETTVPETTVPETTVVVDTTVPPVVTTVPPTVPPTTPDLPDTGGSDPTGQLALAAILTLLGLIGLGVTATRRPDQNKV